MAIKTLNVAFHQFKGTKTCFGERTVLANARRKLYNSSGGAQKKTFWRLTSDHKQAFNALF
jgi:hypothetical protein